MKIHVISDIHLEAMGTVEPTVCGNVCVLAGDICTAKKTDKYIAFIEDIKQNFDHIIMVAGNHEFYHSEYEAGLKTIKSIADDTGSYFLDIEFGTQDLELDGITFWGSTLWTDINGGDWFAKKKVGNGLNDYHVVDGLTTSKTIEIHNRTVESINWNADVVITHHMPILRKHSRFEIDDITYGFNCTDLEEKIAKSNIKWWIYGHTHDNSYNVVGKTNIISNQVGYYKENMTKGYDPKFLIEVKK